MEKKCNWTPTSHKISKLLPDQRLECEIQNWTYSKMCCRKSSPIIYCKEWFLRGGKKYTKYKLK